MEFIAKNPKISQFAVLLVVFFALYFSVSPSETNMLWRLPSLFASFPEAINVFVEYLMYDWMPVEIYDPELEDYEESALVKEVTRGFSRGVLFCIEFIRDILLGGVKTIVAFTSWDFVGENKWAVWPALPWTFVSGGAMVLGYALKGRGLALLAGSATGYIAIFGDAARLCAQGAWVGAFGGICDGIYCYFWAVGTRNGDPVFRSCCCASVMCSWTAIWGSML